MSAECGNNSRSELPEKSAFSCTPRQNTAPSTCNHCRTKHTRNTEKSSQSEDHLHTEMCELATKSHRRLTHELYPLWRKAHNTEAYPDPEESKTLRLRQHVDTEQDCQRWHPRRGEEMPSPSPSDASLRRQRREFTCTDTGAPVPDLPPQFSHRPRRPCLHSADAYPDTNHPGHHTSGSEHRSFQRPSGNSIHTPPAASMKYLFT